MADDTPVAASPGYALGRLRRALETAREHDDPTTRERARRKAEAWTDVIDGMLDGAVSIGSRTPVTETPAWVTLAVAHGGFATGELLAGGPLLDWEQARLHALPDAPGRTERERLNHYYVSDAGQHELLAALRAGAYRIEVPEEAALPIAALLLESGHDADALDLLETIEPLFSRLRFYPDLTPTARQTGSSVHVATVKEVREALLKRGRNPRVAAMNASLSVWTPLYDRLVALWLETVVGEPPHLEGKGAESTVVGGWPGEHAPSGWQGRRQRWLADYRAAKKKAKHGSRHLHPRSNFQRMATVLESAKRLKGLHRRRAGRVRLALANTITKHGLPGDTLRTELRAAQLGVARRPLHADIRRFAADRLKTLPQAGGIDSLEAACADVSDAEAGRLPAGTPMSPAVWRKAERALVAPMGTLIERGIIGAAEVLAEVLPQVTSQIGAAGLADPTLRDLYAANYMAFRRRRSLLLLNLESQVRVSELPWVAAVEPQRLSDQSTQQLARETLEEVVFTALTAFPQTILPNPLVSELALLVAQAKLNLPLVEELAADIFMGTFVAKWSRSAALALDRMEGTAYARYYNLPEPSALPAPRGNGPQKAFAALCARRLPKDEGSWITRNGATIEQSMILTTHNVAPLLTQLELEERLRPAIPDAVRSTFRWISDALSGPVAHRRAALLITKNSAYALRQALCLMAFVPVWQQIELAAAFLQMAATSGRPHLVHPIALGVKDAVDGEYFMKGRSPNGGQRLLGWALDGHWVVGGLL